MKNLYQNEKIHIFSASDCPGRSLYPSEPVVACRERREVRRVRKELQQRGTPLGNRGAEQLHSDFLPLEESFLESYGLEDEVPRVQIRFDEGSVFVDLSLPGARSRLQGGNDSRQSFLFDSEGPEGIPIFLVRCDLLEYVLQHPCLGFNSFAQTLTWASLIGCISQRGANHLGYRTRVQEAASILAIQYKSCPGTLLIIPCHDWNRVLPKSDRIPV